MSTTIPYDPSLVLGNIVPPGKLEVLEAISKLQTPVDSALEELNAAILLKRKLKMTLMDLANLGVDVKPVEDQLGKVDKEITSAATKYAQISVANLPKISQQRQKIAQVSQSVESPIDYANSQIKPKPLSADSLKMDAQYFTYDENKQDSDSTMSSIKAFIGESLSGFSGDAYKEASGSISDSAMDQVSHQREHHDVEGTLIITANCTHKQADIFTPFKIDVDKGIRAWNAIFPSEMIDPQKAASIHAIAEKQERPGDLSINLLSGATYGSCFIGMVHILRTSSTQTSQTMESTAESLQAQFSTWKWYESEKGGFGVSDSFSNSAKSLLSNASISSHVSLITMGVIPDIKAHDTEFAIKEFSKFSPDEEMSQLATLNGDNNDGLKSVTSEAEKAKTGGQMLALQASKIQSVMSAVQKGETEKNKVFDINSLMDAFSSYITKIGDTSQTVGVPINYFLKPITASQLAQMWVAKYFPGKFLTAAGDDSEPTEPKQSDSK